MALGALVGVATGVAVLADVDVPGVGSWLVAVAVAKLGFIAGFSLIAAGALLRRAAARRERQGDMSVGPPTDQRLTSGTPAAEPVAQRDLASPRRAQP